MYTHSCLFLCCLLLCSIQRSDAQTDSIYDQGVYRPFILHLPTDYDADQEYPLVLNLHGLGSNAIEQYFYSQFHLVANEKKFIVVYPEAINNSWDLFGSFDVLFLTHLIDTLRERYSTNECLFSMGMSQGGFLSYKLTCELPYEIAAIASVTGNMISPWQSSCAGTDPTPVMQFHGTSDATVPYNGTFGIPPIEETIDWWVDENDCNATPAYFSFPDIDPNDGSTAEEFRYGMCAENSEVVFYKISGGGHSWPGAIAIPTFGSTNQDINASEIIGDFFAAHCNSTTSIRREPELISKIYPNPISQELTIECQSVLSSIAIYDVNGRLVSEMRNINAFSTKINCAPLVTGFYFLKIIAEDGMMLTSKFVKN